MQNIENLEAKLLALGGEKVNHEITGWDEFLMAVESSGTIFDTEKQTVFGVLLAAQKCHDNAALLCHDIPELEGWTGFALTSQGTWVNHSWCWHPEWKAVIETTGYFKKYFGVRMPVEFLRSELANAEECRTALGIPKELGKVLWAKTHKMCIKCRQEKLLTGFRVLKYPLKDGRIKLWVRKDCRECERVALKKRDPDKLAAAARKWSKDNPEKRNATRRKYNRKYPERYRAQSRKYLYGLSDENFKQMLLDQKACCAICGRVFCLDRKERKSAPHVDHDHITGSIRALLCGPCNSGLGYFQESLLLLQKASEYLQKYSG